MATPLDLTCHFLALVSQQPGCTDPRIPELETKLRARDPTALQLMRQFKSSTSPVALVCTDEMMEAIRNEVGVIIQTDQECLDVLTRLKAAAQRPTTQQLLENAINFVRIPPGTDLDPEQPLPLLDLVGVVDEFANPDELIECIKYMGTMIDADAV
jgi:hypothetical protein